MPRHASSAALALFATLLLGACGGGQSGSSSQAVAQDKAASRTLKQAASPSPYAAAVQELYVAYFGRPADPAGLVNFENALAAANAPQDVAGLAQAYSSNKAVQSLIDSFGTSSESQTLYGSGSTQDFVTAVFNNVLGRAPLAAGLSYWAGAIDSGSLSRGDAALAIMAGALANNSAQGQADTQLIDNRVSVAGTFTAQVSSQDALAAYRGAAAAASARGMLNQIGAGTDLNAFGNSITATITGLLQATPGITLVAGNPASIVQLGSPGGMARDSHGYIYATDFTNHVINRLAPDGTGSVFAGSYGNFGSNDGTGTAARFNNPMGLAIDSADNVYVADNANHTLRKITPAGVVTTFAGTAGAFGEVDGAGQNARLSHPFGLAIDASGTLYVSDADGDGNTIRKVTPGGMVTTAAGTAGLCGSVDGVAASARFCSPGGLVLDTSGNLYIADAGNDTVRKLSPGGLVSTVAGKSGVVGHSDGAAAQASFGWPSWITMDDSGNLFVSDGGAGPGQTFSIRKITPQGVVSTLAGSEAFGFQNGQGAAASFGEPSGMVFDGHGNLLVADSIFSAIRQVTPAGLVSTFASTFGITGNTDAVGAAALFADPVGIVADKAGNLYVADADNQTIRKIAPSGSVTTLAGSPSCDFFAETDGANACFGNPTGLAIDGSGNLYLTDGLEIRVISPAGVTSTLLSDAYISPFYYAGFNSPTGIAADAAGNVVASSEVLELVARVSSTGVATNLAGTPNRNGTADGPGATAAFNSPMGVALDSSGNAYVADYGNHTIRKIAPDGTTSTLAGSAGMAGSSDGTGAAARFRYPIGVALDSAGNLYVADSGNNTIRKITPAGVVSTVAGSASAPGIVLGALPGGLSRPQYLTVEGNNTLYVTSAGAVLRVQLP